MKHSNAPKRPPKIILFGPPGCGKTELAVKIAETFKISYLKVNHLVKDFIRKEGDSETAKDL